MTHIIQPAPWHPGDRVDFINREAMKEVPSILSLTTAQGAMSASAQKAVEASHGARRRCVVDAVIDATTIRLVACDDAEIIWAHPADVEPLDAISSLADCLDKGLKDALED